LHMKTRKQPRSGTESTREPFITIDDVVDKAQKLVTDLKKLAERKYPLDVRKASQVRKEVKRMAKDRRRGESIMIKDGSRTYFIDIEKMSDGKPYLKITESRYKGEKEERERKDIIVFPEKAEEFAQAVSKLVAKLG
jgi:hypothetical protein